MVSEKQREAAKKNIEKAHAKWRAMSPREHAIAQPEGRARAKPGTKGKGEYYRIVVRPKEEFVTFRYHDVGRQGHIQRLAGRRASGSWADETWLISKKDAHIRSGKLIADTSEGRELLKVVGPVTHLRGDIFQGHPRRNVPEREKPTLAQQRARAENIRKAQKARRKQSA